MEKVIYYNPVFLSFNIESKEDTRAVIPVYPCSPPNSGPTACGKIECTQRSAD